MDETQAISLVTEWILWRGLDYPTDELVAERFEVGWTVYAPVDIDDSDPMAFLEMPVGRSVFLIGDSGRIEESSSSVPPGVAEKAFTAEEYAAQRASGGFDQSDYVAAFERQFRPAWLDGHLALDRLGDRETPSEEGKLNLDGDTATATDASALINPIVERLTELGPTGWEDFSAEFAFTATSEVALLRFFSDERTGLVPVPQSIADLVRLQRRAAAQTPEGPWWRLLLKCTDRGETTVRYDYGDEPFPEDQLVAPEHYRNDLEIHPRPHVPVWLAGYIAGPAAQGRGPRTATAAETADAAEGRTATAVAELPPLHDMWARWAVLSAVFAGTEWDFGPRIHPGYASYENAQRSGSTLYMLPGDRAVLSGGNWNSEMLDAAYNGAASLPDLYAGAPFWVNDSVLNSRNLKGQLTFCFWWCNGQWYRGETDTSSQLDAAVPAVITPDETREAMLAQTGPGTENQCESLITAATNCDAARGDVAALFVNRADADVDSAANQLSIAGLLAT